MSDVSWQWEGFMEPPTKDQPHALTREQVEYICKFLVEEHLSKDASTILAHDAAQRETIARLEKEVTKWRSIRTPTHGNCCTCQRCGVDHDSCRCDIDEMVDDLVQAEQQVARLLEAADTLTCAVCKLDMQRALKKGGA